MNINEIKNSMIPRKVKEICWKCESNIHCRNKGCAFRSLGNEYCDEVLLATQEYLEKDKEIERLNNIIKNYEINTIPTLEHNIDVLVDSEDRLNNIINELEKDLYERYNEPIEEEPDYEYHLTIGCVIDKLKELKEK